MAKATIPKKFLRAHRTSLSMREDPKPQRPEAGDIHEIVIRAKQIVRAVCVASEHDDEGFQYALEQVQDMLDEAGVAISNLEDADRRESQP